MTKPFKVTQPTLEESRAHFEAVRTAARDVAAEAQKKIMDALKNVQPGQLVEGQGVYIGKYSLRDRHGKSLGKIFNAFAAPHDLTDAAGKKVTYSYLDTLKRVAELKNWNGFDGTNYLADREIFQVLKDGSYNGGWIIPPYELLTGVDAKGDRTTPDNLLAHKDRGAFSGTFCLEENPNPVVCPGWYWSSTENALDWSADRLTARFLDGVAHSDHKDGRKMSCRPVRLVEVAGP